MQKSYYKKVLVDKRKTAKIINDVKTRNYAVENNGGLVKQIAVRLLSNYSSYSFDLGDLISAGYEGLLIASERFDPSKKRKFSIYAGFWIEKKIRRFIDKEIKYFKKNMSCDNPVNDDGKSFKDLIECPADNPQEKADNTPILDEIKQNSVIMKILRLRAIGHTYREIEGIMGISRETARKYVKRVAKKLLKSL